MAEAHMAVAFSFRVTEEGAVDMDVNHDALRAVWYSGIRSWKKRIGRFKNRFHNGVYPTAPWSFLFILSMLLAFVYGGLDISFGLLNLIQQIPVIRSLSDSMRLHTSVLICGVLLWLAKVAILRYALKALLTYHGWMFDPRGRMSLMTKLWVGFVKLLGLRRPLLYSYQASLPKQSVPKLNDTMKRYLASVKPLKSDEDFKRLERLVQEFQSGIGKKLQRYLVLKSWWATNYVSDWWEEYVYLRGRSPIMVNSNFYGIDAIMKHPTSNQAARAASVVYSALTFRRSIEREELKPLMLNKTIPLCSQQYERIFNTTRLPGVETDQLRHLEDIPYIAVYHAGRYFKMYIYYKMQLLTPKQIQTMLEQILSDASPPAAGEEHLAALTAGDRIPWAKARKEFFSKGVNKTSLDVIEKAAFVLVLEQECQDFDQNDPTSLDRFGKAMLHGKCYDRWFDKSFTLVVCPNGRIGFNAEHSWADAPVMAHLWEHMLTEDLVLQYDDNGKVKGEAPFTPPNPIRLQWEIPEQGRKVIDTSLRVAQELANDVDLHLMMFDTYGKGFVKKCRMSPDAYIQMALQLAYYRRSGKFCLTYEASMTRLFREARTETVRSCSSASANFVKTMDDTSLTNLDRIKALQKAAALHQDGYKLAMTGQGIDRHLFCLYVVSKYLNTESPFLKEVLSEPWRLSTSQTPHQQTEKLDLRKHPDFISAGGGFGPVADDGYGVSYIIAGEDIIFFHISSKKFCTETDSHEFGRGIRQALIDMKALFD